MTGTLPSVHLTISPSYPLAKYYKNNCWLRSLLIVLGYFQKSLDYPEAYESLLKSWNKGAWLSEVARLAWIKGFQAHCYGYNLLYTDPRDRLLSPEQLREKLEREKFRIRAKWSDSYSQLSCLLHALDLGVRYTIAKPDLAIAHQYLAHKIPVMTIVNDDALYHHQDDPYVPHVIVITGIDEKQVFFIDPNFPWERSTSLPDFMFAVTSAPAITADSYFLAVFP